jgi:hypothetical protein
MKNASLLTKIMVAVLIALMLPVVVPAQIPMCEPPYCGEQNCPDWGYNCTNSWIWTHLYEASTIWWMGYTVRVCCAW